MKSSRPKVNELLICCVEIIIACMEGLRFLCCFLFVTLVLWFLGTPIKCQNQFYEFFETSTQIVKSNFVSFEEPSIKGIHIPNFYWLILGSKKWKPPNSGQNSFVNFLQLAIKGSKLVFWFWEPLVKGIHILYSNFLPIGSRFQKIRTTQH
jgi:hypothetical protein